MVIETIRIRGKDTRVKLKCDSCGVITETTLYNYNSSQKKKNWTGKTTCRKCTALINGVISRGKRKSSKGIPRPHLQRENSPSWRGGRYVDVHGYVMVLINDDKQIGKKSKWSKYRKEHVVVMEDFLKRKLTTVECVHHVDGDRQNNKIENLSVVPSNKHHRISHGSLQKIGYELVKAGYVYFDKETFKYTAHAKLRELLGHPCIK